MCEEIMNSRRQMLELIFQTREFSSGELVQKYRETRGEEVRLGATETIGSYLRNLVRGGVLTTSDGKYSLARGGAP